MPLTTNNKLLIAGGALLLLPLLIKATAGKNLNVVFDKIKGFGFSGFNLVLTLQLKIQNPTNSDYTLKALTGSLSIGGSNLANVSIFNQIAIPRTSQVLVPVPITLSTTGIVSDLVEILSGNSTRTLSAQFKGTANVDDFVIPFNQTFSI